MIEPGETRLPDWYNERRVINYYVPHPYLTSGETDQTFNLPIKEKYLFTFNRFLLIFDI